MSIGSNLRGLKESLINMTKGEMDELTKKKHLSCDKRGFGAALQKHHAENQRGRRELEPFAMDGGGGQIHHAGSLAQRYYDNLKKRHGGNGGNPKC